MQGSSAQLLIMGGGFIPDENGTNPDVPIQNKVALAAIVKDCAECPEMVLIPAGSFVMGSEKTSNEQPLHRVTIRSFFMGKTEITQKQWMDVMGSNGSWFYGCGQDCPVDRVSWNDVQSFIIKLNQKSGQRYRLPSEAEWEYGARAGSSTEWSFGNDESILGNYAWYGGNSGYKPHQVGQKRPNAFGLFDTSGNVWEWTQDCWHGNYSGAPTDGSAWMTDCTDALKAVRGGSWGTSPESLRSAIRNGINPVSPSNFIGFRLARDL